MRAELKSVDSPDVDFATYWPEDENCFSFPITLRIGAEGHDAADLFQMTVCTQAGSAGKMPARPRYSVKTC